MPEQEATLQNSWKIIKESFSFYMKHSNDVNKGKRL